MVEPGADVHLPRGVDGRRRLRHTNIGYRCQFNGAIGPYKGGLRFQKNVYPGIIKFLGFEQIFKNSPDRPAHRRRQGRSTSTPPASLDAEVMRFCQSYMQALYRYRARRGRARRRHGRVPGDRISYGEYRRLKGSFENGVLTGKGLLRRQPDPSRGHRLRARCTIWRTSSSTRARISRARPLPARALAT